MDLSLFRLATAGLAAAACFASAFFVYWKNPRGRINRYYALSNSLLGLWNISDIVIVSAGDIAWALFFDRLSYVWGVLVVPCFFQLGMAIAKAPFRKKSLNWFLWLFAWVMASLSLTPLMIKNVEVVPHLVEHTGPLFPVYVVYFVSWLGYGLYSISHAFQTATGLQRNQLRYLLLALGLAFLSGLLYFATILNPAIPPICYVVEIGYLMVLAYAVIRYRAMDINLVFRYVAIYFLFALSLAIPFSLIPISFRNAPTIFLFVFLALFLAPLLEKRAIGWFRHFVDRLPPFRGRYDYLNDLPGFQRAISTSSSVKHWARNLAESINRLVEVDNASVFVFDEGHQMFMAAAAVGMDLGRLVFASPKEGDAMIEHLRTTRAILQREYIDHEVPVAHREGVTRSMGLIGAVLCLPFFNGDRLIGLVSVGAKRKRIGTLFKPTHFEVKIMRDYLDLPPATTPNSHYVHGKLSTALGLTADGDALHLTAEAMAEGFNRLVGQTGWAAGLPQLDSMGLRSEGLALLGKLRRGISLNHSDEAKLNEAVLAHFYRSGLRQYEQEDTFNEEDIKALESLVRGAEGALMVIFVTLAGQMKTAEWAHDLRHPFTKGSFRLLDAALAGKQGPITPELYHTLSTVLADAKFVEERITDLVSPDTAGAMRLKAVNMTPLLKALMERYGYFAGLAGIDFSLKSEPAEDVWALCDAGLIQYRVFNNLIDNAFRHTPRGGSVEIGAGIAGGQAKCFVRNTGGEPIPADILPHLFERGGSLKRAESGERGLAGLGLYNASTVVEAHGGKLQVTTDRERGTLFQFTLPLAGVELKKPKNTVVR